MKRSLPVSCLLALLGASPCAAQGPIRDGAFVEVEGTRFVVSGQPFHVVGANVAVTHGEAQRRAMSDVLGAIAADGGNVVRVWALGEYRAEAPPWSRSYAFRAGEEGWIEGSFAHLDAVLARARALDLRVIVVLSNRWGDYGGATQYLRWAGYEVEGDTVPVLGLAAFWDCAPCERAYEAHVRRVVSRHAEDPTVFAWELMNEAEAAGVRGEASMLAWMQRQTAFLRSVAPHHLVSAGHIGYTGLHDRDVFRDVCALDGVDYCDSHAYPLRAGRVRSAAALGRWIDDRVQLAHHVIRKPILFGEVGFPTDQRTIFGTAPATWFDRFFTRLAHDGAAGALLWTYLPSGDAARPYGIYASGARVAQTLAIRRVVARHAGRLRRAEPRSHNPRLGPERGGEPLFDPTVTVTRRSTPHDTWTDDILHIDPRELARAHFERAETWDGDPGLPHFYGAGAGEVSYRLRTPRARPSVLVVRLHASSELPGAGLGAGPEDTSTLTIELDGVELGTLTAPPDDGVGDTVELRVEVPALPPRRVRLLTIGADRGVCLYARDTEGRATGIEVRWEQ